MNWKTRNELPGLIKLSKKFDIDRLRFDVHEYASRNLKDSMKEGPYKNLRDAYGYNLTPAASVKQIKKLMLILIGILYHINK